LIVGVNGTGKNNLTAKLAHLFKRNATRFYWRSRYFSGGGNRTN